MKIRFTSEAVVGISNGNYYKTGFGAFIERYKYFGDVIFGAYKREVLLSKQSQLQIEGVRFEFFDKENSLLNFVANRKRNKLHMKRCVRDADIVVAHLPSPIGMLAIEYAKKYGKPYFIGVVGCTWDACWNYNWKGKIVAFPYYISMRRAIRKAKYVFYVTQKFLQRRYPNTGVSIGCSNVEISEISEKILSERLRVIASLNLKSTVNLVTIAAVNVRYKGQEYVIKALKKLNNDLGFKFHYYLIGGGDNTFLQNLTKQLKLEEYVHFVGPIPHELIWEYLDKMHVYVQPSKQEGLPRALIEAMSRALPSFGSRTAGIPELLPEDCIFDNGNVNEIVSLLSSLTTDKMKEYAKINFDKSKEYTSDVLTERRKRFFDTILSDIRGDGFNR